MRMKRTASKPLEDQLVARERSMKIPACNRLLQRFGAARRVLVMKFDKDRPESIDPAGAMFKDLLLGTFDVQLQDVDPVHAESGHDILDRHGWYPGFLRFHEAEAPV